MLIFEAGPKTDNEPQMTAVTVNGARFIVPNKKFYIEQDENNLYLVKIDDEQAFAIHLKMESRCLIDEIYRTE